MNSITKLLLIAAMFVFMGAPTQADAQSTFFKEYKIERMFESLIDEVRESENPSDTKEKIKSLQRLELLIGKSFGYDEIFNRIFGASKYLFSGQEEAEVKELMLQTLKILFTGMVRNFYMDDKRENIDAQGLISNDERTVKIQTKVKLDGEECPIEYTLYSANKVNYRIVDITFKGVSVVNNYRIQVAGVIDKHSHGEVLTRLRTFHQKLSVLLNS